MDKLKLLYNKEFIVTKIYIYVILFICILVSFSIYASNKVIKRQEIAVQDYFKTIAVQTASNLRGRVNNQLYELRLLSAKLSAEGGNANDSTVYDFLFRNIQNDNYHRLAYIYPSGKSLIVQNGKGKLPIINLNHRHCFKEAMEGRPCFAHMIKNEEAPAGFVNEYYTPVYNQNRSSVIGVLASMSDGTAMQKILKYNNFKGNAYTDIIDRNGNYIIKSPDSKSKLNNFFENNKDFIDVTKDEILERLFKGEDYAFLYKDTDGVTYVASFVPILTDQNLFVLSIIPRRVIILYIDILLYVVIGIIVFLGLFLISLIRYTNKLHKINEATIYKTAFLDDITGGINKNKFLLDARLTLDNSSEDENFAMISMDITKFKIINELYGLEKANDILKDVYNIIKKNVTDKSIVTRDFAATFLILYQYEKEEYITKYFINKILDDIKTYNSTVMQNLTAEEDYKVTSKLYAIFGIYLINDKTGSLVQMNDRASIAKRSLKDNIMSNIQFYDDTYRAEMFQNKAIEDEMYSALESKQFNMYLQPKFDLNNMELKGAEALVRWIHPQKGIIPPGEFIPLFERNGFIMEIDKSIWQQACQYLANLNAAGEKLFPVSVNVSRLHLNNDAFISELVRLVKDYNIDPKYIELELTESACLNNENRFTQVIEKLKSYGFTIAMDDFGTGYSSLNTLRYLPVDVLKLDRGFITDAILDEKGKIVVKNILAMANELNLQTVAEGVETPEQAIFLKQAGCQIAQGFLFGRPVDIEKFTSVFLSKENSEYLDVDYSNI